MLTLCILVYIHRNSKLIWLFQSDSLVLALKFSQPIRLLNSFTQSISRVAKPSDFIFYMAVQHHDWNQLNKFWSLTGFDILSGCPLKSSAFESIFKLMKNCHFLTFLLLFFLKDAFKFSKKRCQQSTTFLSLFLFIFKIKPTFILQNSNKAVFIFYKKEGWISIVCIGVSTPPPQKHHPSFLPSPPLYWFFVNPSKSQIFQWTAKILKFFILNTILS